MTVLEHQGVRLALDETGRLSSLSLAGGTNIIQAPTGLFRAVIRRGDNWEDVAFAADQALTVAQRDDGVTVRCERLVTREGALDISVEMTIRLENGRIFFGSSITNNSGATVNEWIYPCLGVVDSLGAGKPDLLYPRHLGERIVDIGGYLQGLENREALHEITATYPGPLSMQWMLLEDERYCLYLTGRDTLFHASALRAAGSGDGGVTLEMNKMAFVRPGETWECPGYLAWLYEGDWMKGAAEYAQWASTWRKPVAPKDWIRRMNGYFLVINKQQYGDELWPYDTLPQLYSYAQAHGFDALGLFGWYHTGHDNHYPDLEVSDTMGGAQGLKDNIRKVQEMGGFVTLYYQGHLMDVGTEYYRNTGHALEGKTRWGTPYYEYYDKYCHSDYLHFFSRKPFSTICPSCAGWHDMMAERADWVRGFGADGILYDQIGGMPPYPCFDGTHPHLQDRPSLSHAPGRIALHRRIRSQVDRHAEFAYMTEHVTDVHSQFIDCVHGIGSYPGAMGTGYLSQGPGSHDLIASATLSSGPVSMPEMFRYTFPQTMVTIRNPNPFVSRRFANYALFYGFKLEMELRYLKDKQFIESGLQPQDLAYVKQVSDLRKEHAEYLLEGRFLAQEGLDNGNPMVKAALVSAPDGATAAVLWNDTPEEQPVAVSAQGARWNAWAAAGEQGEGMPGVIGPGQVMLLYQH